MNIVGVAVGGSATAASDGTILDVDGCSEISSLSKRFPSDSTRTCDEGRLTSKTNEGTVMLFRLKQILNALTQLVFQFLRVEKNKR